LQSLGNVFGRGGVGDIGNISAPNVVQHTFLNFLKRGTKSKVYQKCPHEYRSTATQECIHAVSFHFHVTTSLEFKIFKMGAKLGALPLVHKGIQRKIWNQFTFLDDDIRFLIKILKNTSTKVAYGVNNTIEKNYNNKNKQKYKLLQWYIQT
jgi:hypothetical protein